MTFDAAVNLAREIGHRTSCLAFVYTEPGSLNFNFRFGVPIEDVPGTTEVSLARVNLDGTMIHLGGPAGIVASIIARDRQDLRGLSPEYDSWLAERHYSS